MNTTIDERFREEAARFSLRFACEDCAHASHARGQVQCSFGYPPAPRREALRDTHLDFCKAFELV
jgi:hypothetical protein